MNETRRHLLASISFLPVRLVSRPILRVPCGDEDDTVSRSRAVAQWRSVPR